jgi:ATP-dependent RNA helicase RhlE
MTATTNRFTELGIAPALLEAIGRLGFTEPTPVQQQAIPVAIAGRDLIGIAQTGTGKTLAFGVPMLQRLAGNGRCGLVLVPTRELALQVNEALQRLTAAVRIRTAVLIGGESMQTQIQRLRESPRIIVATPGRLNDHLNQRRLHLDQVGVLVLDEADRMLDMGFFPQIERVLKTVPKDRQTMLFSATIPAEVLRIADDYLRDPARVEVAPSGTAAATVSQEMFVVRREHKGDLLGELLKDGGGSVLLFVRTKRGASRVARQLRTQGHSAAEIHADRTLGQRKNALRGFKSGEYRVLVATDIAARGIDVSGIELVVNYDLPDDPENYVHRIGRTGRAGKEGRAITLATPDQGQEVRQIEKMLRASIPRAEHPEVPAEHFTQAAVAQARPQGGRPQAFGQAPRPQGQGGRPPRRGRGSRPGGFGRRPSPGSRSVPRGLVMRFRPRGPR